jgi:hypothetical protein
MLHGCKNYFSFFGLMLFSVNITLQAISSKYENVLKRAPIMIEAFLRAVQLSPLLIQQKIKIKN